VGWPRNVRDALLESREGHATVDTVYAFLDQKRSRSVAPPSPVEGILDRSDCGMARRRLGYCPDLAIGKACELGHCGYERRDTAG
jgi:hypothetical protein